MKRNAADILSAQISDTEKMELMITHMCRGDMRFILTFLNKFQAHATDAQRATFIKLYNTGWHLQKIVWHRTEPKIAFGVYLDGCAAWVAPDGKLERAPVGRRTAYLDKNWVEA